MLRRRIRKHIASQNWTAVGIDFLIVVVGVFMGLQAQEWNQLRVDRETERRYLASLADDFEQISGQLQECLRVFDDSVSAVDYVAAVLAADPRATPEPDRDAFGNALLRMTASVLPPGRSATFLEMQFSGELTILRDDELRHMLIAYDQRADINREIWRTLRDEESAYGRPLYRNARVSVDTARPQVATIRDFDMEAMRNDPDFTTLLNVLAGTKGNSHELCRYQLGLAADVSGRLALR